MKENRSSPKVSMYIYIISTSLWTPYFIRFLVELNSFSSHKHRQSPNFTRPALEWVIAFNANKVSPRKLICPQREIPTSYSVMYRLLYSDGYHLLRTNIDILARSEVAGNTWQLTLHQDNAISGGEAREIRCFFFGLRDLWDTLIGFGNWVSSIDCHQTLDTNPQTTNEIADCTRQKKVVPYPTSPFAHRTKSTSNLIKKVCNDMYWYALIFF